MPKFIIEYDVRGKCTDTIEAKSKEEATKYAVERLKDDENFIDLEELTDVDYSISEMFKVKRNGQVIQTTFIRATDVRIA